MSVQRGAGVTGNIRPGKAAAGFDSRRSIRRTCFDKNVGTSRTTDKPVGRRIGRRRTQSRTSLEKRPDPPSAIETNVACRLLCLAAVIFAPMLAKFFAFWLVVLTVLPFTAPFSTCDLSALLGSTESPRTPFVPAGSGVATDAAVASLPGTCTAGRVRLQPLSGVAVVAMRTPPASVRRAGTSVASSGIRPFAVLATVLRL